MYIYDIYYTYILYTMRSISNPLHLPYLPPGVKQTGKPKGKAKSKANKMSLLSRIKPLQTARGCGKPAVSCAKARGGDQAAASERTRAFKLAKAMGDARAAVGGKPVAPVALAVASMSDAELQAKYPTIQPALLPLLRESTGNAKGSP